MQVLQVLGLRVGMARHAAKVCGVVLAHSRKTGMPHDCCMYMYMAVWHRLICLKSAFNVYMYTCAQHVQHRAYEHGTNNVEQEQQQSYAPITREELLCIGQRHCPNVPSLFKGAVAGGRVRGECDSVLVCLLRGCGVSAWSSVTVRGVLII